MRILKRIKVNERHVYWYLYNNYKSYTIYQDLPKYVEGLRVYS
jgi:hypothetical protein